MTNKSEGPTGTAAAIPTTMRAAVWNGDGRRLAIERIPTPVPKAGEALVRVAACGVCHTDLHVLKGEVAFPAPAVLGHEVSGVVVALGADDGSAAPVSLGDRVVGAFIMPCGKCRQCLRNRDDLCEVFFSENRLKGNLLDGSSRLARSDGTRLSMYSMSGMAEYSVIPFTALARLPDGVPLEEAAVLGCAGLTSFGAASAAELAPSDSVAIVAVGGVGSGIVQIAAHRGASPIIAIDVDDAKLESARALGATVLVNSRRDDVRASVAAACPDGVDVVFEALGRPETVELAVSLLGPGGRLVVVGIAAGSATASVPITPLVRRGQSIRGSFGARTRRDLPRIVEVADAGGFDVSRLVTRRFTLDEADSAYAELDAGRITGRALIIPS